MYPYLLGFVWSIFFVTLLWSYLPVLWRWFFGVVLMKNYKSFVWWLFLWLISIVTFLIVNNWYESPPRIVKWVITKSIGESKYELQTEEWLYILQTNKHVGLWSIVSVSSFKFLSYEKITIWLFGWNNHEIVHRDFSYPKRLYVKWYMWVIQFPKNITVHWNKQTLYNTFQSKIITTFGWWYIWWLLQWMIVGWRRGISKEQYQTFIDSWLVHIIAVSWSNIMMVVIFSSYVLFFVPVIVRRVLLWWIVIFYVLFCWIDSSILRALLFALLNLIVLFFWGRITFVRLLTYTLTAILLYNPFLLLYDLWLLLSVGSLIWLYCWNRWCSTSIQWIDTYILSSFFASLWVLPVLLIYTWTFNILSPLATIIISPLLSPLLLLSVCTLLFTIPFLETISTYWLELVFIIAQYGQHRWVYINM